MNKFFQYMIGAATLLSAGCSKADWENGNTAKPVRVIGSQDMFINITAPGSVSNIVITKSDGSRDQYMSKAEGNVLLTAPQGYNFVSQANRAPNTAGSTTDFYRDNRYTILQFETDAEILRYEGDANALARFKGNNLKADSINTYVVMGILHNSKWNRIP